MSNNVRNTGNFANSRFSSWLFYASIVQERFANLKSLSDRARFSDGDTCSGYMASLNNAMQPNCLRKQESRLLVEPAGILC
jgi:hypothetical protein